MASQERGTSGHIMAAFDRHDNCACCRERKIGQEFSDLQKQTLSTPSYCIRKEKKSGSLVSQKNVTIIASVETRDSSDEASSVQLVTHALSPHSQPVSFVTSEQFAAMNAKWTEQFARFEALF